MRRKIASMLLLALSFTVGGALAHGGKTHKLLGTVKSLQEERLTVTTPDGHEQTVELTADTAYEKDGKPAEREDVTAGTRVAIELDESDTRAVKLKIGARDQYHER